ncbi:MAG: hypothetical protein KF787_04745 [Phycisphaeraceae bacterium]|nr:hypothetical protein [Phycisphaerae bacterium]MBX3391937.1 hypothetical protein [Phycisphaeraceae bacterium]
MVDERREIREGAGLDEARLNQDFIDFLRRWSTPFLVVVAVVAVGYAGYTRWQERKNARFNDAYAEFERVAGVNTPSPTSLRRLAEDYEGVGGVSLLARLQAADLYLQAVRRGIKAGAQVEFTGEIANAEDAITPQDRLEYLDQAWELFSKVARDARRNDSQLLIAIGATYGLAAVAECREDYDAARTQFEAIVAMATGSPYADHAAVARDRIADLDRIRNVARLFAKAELPAEAVAPPSPFDPQPSPPAAGPPAPRPPADPQGPPADAPSPADPEQPPAPTADDTSPPASDPVPDEPPRRAE